MIKMVVSINFWQARYWKPYKNQPMPIQVPLWHVHHLYKAMVHMLRSTPICCKSLVVIS